MSKKISTPEVVLPKGRVLVWDIETTDFSADFGHMLMWSAKFTDEDDVYYSRIDESTTWRDDDPESRCNDREVVQEFVNLVDEADVLVHHYGDKFDWRFLVTRCLANGITPPGQKATVDTWKVARNHLKLTSNRLANIAEFLNDEDSQKGGLSKAQWKLAAQGHKPTLDAMLEYCIGDVIATEQIYLKLRQVMNAHPHIAAVEKGVDVNILCPACGSSNTRQHGLRRTKLTLQHRRRCEETNCRHVYISKRETIPTPTTKLK